MPPPPVTIDGPMNEPIDFRIGELEDAATIAGLIIAAGGGLFQYLLSDVVSGVEVDELLRLGVTAEATPLHYSNAILATRRGQTLGMALSYPAEEYGAPDVVRNITPPERFAALDLLFSSRVPDTLYVNSLAVRAEARQQGVARRLLELVSAAADEAGYNGLSLHVWSDNGGARALYEAFGFVEVDSVPARRRLPGVDETGEMILLHCPTGVSPA